ncbi:hypothetical protein AHAS_Ahas15G0312300 [Arachis hypogaea]
MEETVQHCIISCGQSWSTWLRSEIGAPGSQTDQEVWQQWIELTEKLKRSRNGVKKLREAANLMWEIWKARNRFMFDGEEFDEACVLERARRSESEFQACLLN